MSFVKCAKYSLAATGEKPTLIMLTRQRPLARKELLRQDSKKLLEVYRALNDNLPERIIATSATNENALFLTLLRTCARCSSADWFGIPRNIFANHVIARFLGKNIFSLIFLVCFELVSTCRNYRVNPNGLERERFFKIFISLSSNQDFIG